MAILDRTFISGSLINDRDENIFIGLDLPIRKSDGPEGFFASTKTTIGAVKNNIKNLLYTERGERLMKPNFGLGLRRFLFEQLTQESIITIENEIIETIGTWLPFVSIRKIDIRMKENGGSLGLNTLYISIDFSINQDPTTLESLQLEIGE